ncbi:hypothetical protein HYALB_00001468 [Hymenoscyphus albidus]|uniref:Uncharacterized protein n=1 Tax=Hymenoscyphus albidus TaxID=595503 RepID=A0A9N9LGS1_9HELO|nr:hypothetical protein HYALB_00001468 [Hymenoscyphus albidus]
MAQRAPSPSPFYRPGNLELIDHEPESPRGRKRRRSSIGVQLANKHMSTLRGRARYRSLSILGRRALHSHDNETNSADEEEEDELFDASSKVVGIAVGAATLAAVKAYTDRVPSSRAAVYPHLKKLADSLVILANSGAQSETESETESSNTESTISPSKNAHSKALHEGNKRNLATSNAFDYSQREAGIENLPMFWSEKKKRSQSPSRSRSRNEKNRGTPRPRRRQRTHSRSRRHD